MSKGLFKKEPKKIDFQEEQLPSSRPELFWDIIKNEFRKLFFVSFTLLVFALPFLGLRFFCDFYSYALVLNGQEATWPRYIFLVGNPLCCLVFGIGIGGCMRIIKRLCYLQPVFLWEDFKLGIKQNGKQSALGAFLIGLFFSATYLLHLLHPESLLWDIPFGLFALMVYPGLFFAFVVIATYTTRIGETFSLSFKLYFKSFLTSLIPLIVFCLPFFFEYVPDLVLKYILILAFLIFVSPLYLLGIFLYQTSLLDKFVNKEKYPELVDRGIHRKGK